MKSLRSRTELMRVLKQEICRLHDCRMLNADDIAPTDRLTSELGIDSISVIELGFNIEKTLRVNIRITDWYDHAAPEHTLQSLLEYVIECVDSASTDKAPDNEISVVTKVS